MPYARHTEIRHLGSADIIQLSQILDQKDSWKKLMRIIPKRLESTNQDLSSFNNNNNNNSSPTSTETTTTTTTEKYNTSHIRLIENASCKQNRLATEILFEEWGSSGKIRPNMKHLLQLLIKAELYRAADYVSVNILNEKPPERPLKGPAAKIDITLPSFDEFEPYNNNQQIETILSDISYPRTASLIENNTSLPNNNKDFYDKRGIDGIKKIEIVSSTSTPAAATTSNTENNNIDVTRKLTITNQNNISNNANNNQNNHNNNNNGINTGTSDLIKFSTSTIDNNEVAMPNRSIFQLHQAINGSDLMKFSSSIINGGDYVDDDDDYSQNIPEISQLMKSQNNTNRPTNNSNNRHDNCDDDNNSNNNNHESDVNNNNNNHANQSNNHYVYRQQFGESSNEIPNISLLHNTNNINNSFNNHNNNSSNNNNNNNNSIYNMPNISGLYLGNGQQSSILDTRNTNTSASEISQSYESYDSGSYVIPTDYDDDGDNDNNDDSGGRTGASSNYPTINDHDDVDDGHSRNDDNIPNLSILNEELSVRQNNNEQNLECNSSNSVNIPCLSALIN